MNKLIEMIKHNFIFKLISLFLAFLVWIVAVNISNPEITQSATVALDVRNDALLTDNEKTYTIDTQTVRISYKIRNNYQRLVSSQDFTAYVDLRDYSVTGAVPIYVEASESASQFINDISQSPLVAHIETEDLIEIAVDLAYEIIGTPAENKNVEYVSLSSDNIRVYGPRSEVEQIAKAVVTVDAENAVGDLRGSGEIRFYDAYDNLITFGELAEVRDDITYYAAVYGRKILSLSAVPSGSPAAGYLYSGVNITPQSVPVRGPDDILAAYSSLEIPSSWLDIDGRSSNVTFDVNISSLLPGGLILESDGNINVLVFIGRDESYIEETDSESSPESDGEETGDDGISEGREDSAANEDILTETDKPGPSSDGENGADVSATEVDAPEDTESESIAAETQTAEESGGSAAVIYDLSE